MKDTLKQDVGLVLTLSLSTLVCILCAFMEISMLLFATAVPFFCLQLLLLRLTKKLPLRLIPVCPIVLMLLAAGYYWLFGKGWDALAALVLALASVAPAVGCLAAALVYRFSGRLMTRKWLLAALVLLGWGGAWLGQEISLDYWDRAFIKALSFGCCVGLYWLVSTPSVTACGGDSSPARGEPRLFCRPDRKSLKVSAALALAVFLFLTVGYMVLSPWLDLSAIPDELRYSGITAETFPMVAAYITLVNSLLEEVFFRGFAFLTLRRHASQRFAYGFSGLAFAAYHVSIMSGWFHPIWFVVFIAGLAVAGMLFDFLDRRGSVWCGWLVHMAANLAINLIGMRMFGII